MVTEGCSWNNHTFQEECKVEYWSNVGDRKRLGLDDDRKGVFRISVRYCSAKKGHYNDSNTKYGRVVIN